MEEARLAAEDLLAVPHRPPQDATKHVAATVVGRAGAVRDGDGQGADVVGHDSIRHVNVVGVLFANLLSRRTTAEAQVVRREQKYHKHNERQRAFEA